MLSLEGASEADLAVYLDSLSPEQLRGVANNVKGFTTKCCGLKSITHTHTDSYATMHQSTTHQGSDVQIFSQRHGRAVGRISA